LLPVVVLLLLLGSTPPAVPRSSPSPSSVDENLPGHDNIMKTMTMDLLYIFFYKN
jgi:hypothetical protein